MTPSSTTDFPGNATPAQLLYPDLAQELATTRKMIALVPDGQNDWKPHEKSMSLAKLASHVAGSWTLRAGPQVYLSGRKATLLRTMGISHLAHHRAQLGVYLRLLGVPIPGAYGPSADEM